MLNVSFWEVCSPYILVFLLLIGLAYRESMVINNIALVQKIKDVLLRYLSCLWDFVHMLVPILLAIIRIL